MFGNGLRSTTIRSKLPPSRCQPGQILRLIPPPVSRHPLRAPYLKITRARLPRRQIAGRGIVNRERKKARFSRTPGRLAPDRWGLQAATPRIGRGGVRDVTDAWGIRGAIWQAGPRIIRRIGVGFGRPVRQPYRARASRLA